MYKKRWYDGLHDIYEGKNEFEIKFGCFGGDGGGGGGKKDPQPAPTPAPTPDTGFRGEQSTAAKAAVDAAKAAAQAEVEANLAGKAQAAQDIQGKVADAVAASTGKIGPVDVGGPKGLSIGTPAEQLATTTTTRTPQEIADSVSLAGLSTGPISAPTTQTGLLDITTPVGLTGSAIAPSLQKGFANVQKGIIDQAYAEYQNQPNLATQNALDSLNQGIKGAQYSDPTTTGFQGFSPFNPTPGKFGVGVKAKFGLAKGGVVQQGIGSIFPYPRRR